MSGPSGIFVLAVCAALGHSPKVPAAPAVGGDEWSNAVPAAVTPVPAIDTAAADVAPWVRFVGYFHSTFVHLPIAWLLLLGLADALAWWRRHTEWVRAGHWLLGLGLASFVPAMATGFARIQSHTGADALWHRNLMLSAFAMLLVAGGLRWWARGQLVGTRRFAYLGFVAVAIALTVAGAHAGGQLIFGPPPGL